MELKKKSLNQLSHRVNIFVNIVKVFGVGIAIFFAISIFLRTYIYGNNSISEPLGFYFVTNVNEIKKGETYVITIPDYYMQIIKKLGYKANSNTLTKTVVAVQGDIVNITESGVLVNNELIPNSAIFESAKGVNLYPQKIGYHHKLVDNEYWVMGITLHSYDSRYYGILNKSYFKKHAVYLGDWSKYLLTVKE